MRRRLTNKKRTKVGAMLAITPMVAFTLFFVFLPFLYLFVMSFSKHEGTVSFTFANYARIWDRVYRKVYTDSIILGLISTFIVALIGYPFGYFMAKQTPGLKKLVNYLLVIPFSVSSLLRLYSWDILLRADGPINKFLLLLGAIEKPLRLRYTYGATIIGIVYALLPFMIFSVYSSAEKLDWTLIEASRDLGANSSKAFWTISFPLTLPGLLSGVILTFIPSMGLIFIAEILGGNKITLVGNLIVQEATQGKNRPFAAALSIILMLVTALFIWGYRKLFKVEKLEGLV